MTRNFAIKISSVFLFIGITILDCRAADTTTASSTTNETKFEWTYERMLMATAMPMTGEERQFLQAHKSLEGIRDWKFAEFESYIQNPLGKKHVAEEAMHWRGVVVMLREQAASEAQKKHKSIPALVNDSTSVADKSYEQMLDALSNDASKKEVFEQMKVWRQQIAVLAPFVSSMREN